MGGVRARAPYGGCGMQNERRQTPQNVILIGFMGTGKTSAGKLIARSLGFDFVDTDELIVERAGKPITEIFEEVGQAGFREVESAVLADLKGSDSSVISTGGGIVTVPENVAALQALGMVVWLDASADAIFERVSGNNERPLLQTEDPLGTIREMLDQRTELYEAAADQRVDTEGLHQDELAYGVAESARVWFGSV